MKAKSTTTDLMPRKPRKFDYKAAVLEDLYRIGFKKSFIKHLFKKFNDKFWDSYKDSHLNTNHVVDDIVNTIDTDIDNILQNIRVKYRKQYTLITQDIKNHYSIQHLVQIIVEYANGVYNQISKNVFLYQHHIENIWFRNKNNELCFNAMTKDDVQIAIRTLSYAPKLKLFYHATNWNSIEGILEDGPKFNKGRVCLDFGINESFYVTPDIKTAIEWAKLPRFNSEGGIIVFALNIKEFQNFIEFHSPTNKWKELVKSSRMCKVRSNELDRYNFVYGPMLRNTKEVKTLDGKAKAHFPIKWQLASKNSFADQVLKDGLLGTIFLKKHIR